MNEPSAARPDDIKTMAHVVYGCYVASFLIGITSIVGVILAYLKRKDAEGTIYASHFQWQIRTFWITFIAALIGLVLSIIFIGVFIVIAAVIWYLYRCIKGWLRLYEGRPIENPAAFF